MKGGGNKPTKKRERKQRKKEELSRKGEATRGDVRIGKGRRYKQA